jgi:hypothetical protein
VNALTGIVTRDGDNALAIAHYDVLALTHDPEPFQRARRQGD